MRNYCELASVGMFGTAVVLATHARPLGAILAIGASIVLAVWELTETVRESKR